ncbi:MAG: HAMP domain-containing histidine kinase [Deltaproteobacteria bacterium]|jgi:signal transduction histidine kinase|nr:HAMP domain-containing histidine kinase [Deltaproteobacteria bacterium]
MTRVGFLAGFHGRIFLVTVLMILLAQAVYVFIVYLNSTPNEDWRLKLADYLAAKIQRPLTGRSLAEADIWLDYYNGLGPQLWFESLEGQILAGTPVAVFAPLARNKLDSPSLLPQGQRIWRAEGAWETGPNSPLEMMAFPVHLQDGPVLLCYVYWAGKFPYHSRNFSVGSAVLLVLGAALTWRAARGLAKPLEFLRREVLTIDCERLNKRVTVQGPREVADVARSINALADSLERRDRLLRDLMASVSHDLRSPLTRLDFALTFMGRGLVWSSLQMEAAKEVGFEPLEFPESYVEELSRPGVKRLAVTLDNNLASPPPSDPLSLALKYHSVYQVEIDRMDELIGATLLANRLDLGHALIAPKALDFSSLCLALAQRFQPIFRAREMDFRFDIEPRLYLVGEERLLERLLDNILDNAAKYTRPQGQINLALGRPSSETILLTLKNSCEPLGARRLAKLFEPYYRLNQEGSGAGLGLALVKRIVDVHGGKVWATNGDWGFRLDIAWKLDTAWKNNNV